MTYLIVFVVGVAVGFSGGWWLNGHKADVIAQVKDKL